MHNNNNNNNDNNNQKVGDRILAVNDNDVRKATQEQAINLIKNAGSTIKLDIQSFDLSVNYRFSSHLPLHIDTQ